MNTQLIARMLEQYAEIEAVKMDVEGMKATNAHCAIAGRTPVFDEPEFTKKANEIRGIRNYIHELWQSYG